MFLSVFASLRLDRLPGLLPV